MKLPDFWTTDSELWFLLIESLLRKIRISSQLLKYYHIVAAVLQTNALIIRDMLRAPPAKPRYDKLKSDLIRRSTESDERRIQQFLTTQVLGGRKPSELFRSMYELLRCHTEALDALILR